MEVAAAHGLTPSEAIRRLVRGVTGLPLAADSRLKPSIEALVEQLRRAGVNLNQAVRAMHEGRAGFDQDLARTLTALIVAVEGSRRAYGEIIREPRRLTRATLTRATEQ